MKEFLLLYREDDKLIDRLVFGQSKNEIINKYSNELSIVRVLPITLTGADQYANVI